MLTRTCITKNVVDLINSFILGLLRDKDSGRPHYILRISVSSPTNFQANAFYGDRWCV